MDPSSTQNKNMVEVGQSLSQSLSHFRVLRMGCAESQILVTHSYLTNFRWSGELHHDLHLATLPIVIKKLVNWLTKKLYEICRLSCYDQYILLRHGDQLRPNFWLTLMNFLFWVSKVSQAAWLRPQKCPRLHGSVLKSVQGCLGLSSRCPRLPGSIL